ncbi:MAG TPA: alpha/beta fold hydrolase [Mycobacterium sp.]|nr:alpha/beta fold hydrolase [Mycobacterium sp.]
MISVADLGRRAVGYDRRGHGRSDDLGRGYDYNRLADDMAAVIHHLDLRDVTLVAHSMDSGEVVRYLTRHGDGRIGRLVLLAPITPFLQKAPDNSGGVDSSLFALQHAPHGSYLTHRERVNRDLLALIADLEVIEASAGGPGTWRFPLNMRD